MNGGLYLGAVHFDGDPAALLPAYHRLLQRFPLEALDLHVCIGRDGGLTVFDACPSRAVYEEFTRSEQFRGAIAAAGLPAPRVESLGEVRLAHIRHEVRP